MDSAGNIYVSEGINGDILKVPVSGGSYGTPATVASGLDYPQSLTVDGAGNIFFASYGKVEKVPYSGGSYGSPVVLTSGFTQITATTLDSAGNIYVVDAYTYAVSKIPYSGGSYGTPVTVGSALNHPGGVAVDGAGNVFVTVSGGVQEIPYSNGSYGAPASLSFSGVLYFPSDIAMDGSGNIYVSDNGYIKELAYNGGFSHGYIGPSIVGGTSLFDLALDSAGTVYALNDQATQYGQIDSVAKIGPVQQVYDFGASNVGLASPVTKTLYFALDYGGTIYAPVVQGSAGADFTDTGTGSCSTYNGISSPYNATGDVCTVVLSFTPTVPGVRNAGVGLFNTDGKQLVSANLQGTGIGAQVTYPPGLAPNAGTFVTNHGAVNPYMQVSVPASDGFTTTYVSEYPNGSESGFGGFQITSLSGSGGTSGDLSCGACSPRASRWTRQAVSSSATSVTIR